MQASRGRMRPKPQNSAATCDRAPAVNPQCVTKLCAKDLPGANHECTGCDLSEGRRLTRASSRAPSGDSTAFAGGFMKGERTAQELRELPRVTPELSRAAKRRRLRRIVRRRAHRSAASSDNAQSSISGTTRCATNSKTLAYVPATMFHVLGEDCELSPNTGWK
jgi:hypothetical protein